MPKVCSAAGAAVTYPRSVLAEMDELGQGMVEYALLLVLMAIVSVGLLTVIGNTLTHDYSTIFNAL